MKSLFTTLFFLALVFPILMHGQSTKDQINKIVSNYVEADGPGMAVLATESGKVIYEHAFGLSNVSTRSMLNTNTVFRIGSITKQFTAMAILKLFQEQKLSLNDPINHYLPIQNPDKTITIQQLLNHTSGLGNQSDIPDFNATDFETINYPDNALEMILNASLRFPPGQDYYYSNLGYILLGKIIEVVSNMRYEDYLRTSFFIPLNMQHTGFEYLDFREPVCTGYSRHQAKYVEADPINMKIPFAAGGMVSSLSDLALWNEAVMTGSVIPLPLLSIIKEPHQLPNGNSTGYSTGWQIGMLQGLKTIKHDGIVNGFTSMMIYIPEKELFIAAFTNSDSNRDIELPTSKIGAALMNRSFPEQGIDLTKDELDHFQGIYQNKGSEVRVALHDNALMYFTKGGDKIKLIPTAHNLFLLAGSLNQLKFNFEDTLAKFTHLSLDGETTWQFTQPMEGYVTKAIDIPALDSYVGKYQVPGQFVFEVVRIEDKLFGQVGGDKKELICYDTDKFCGKNIDALVDFVRDSAGEVTAVELTLGMKISADKVE